MPNYEELYYATRNKYYQAVENRNNIRRTTNELQGKRTSLINELGQKKAALAAARQKVAIVEEAENKCRSIINDQFPSMKKYVESTSAEYKKIITSDKGVADIQTIYSSDIQSTQNDLNSILSGLEQKRKALEAQATEAQQAVNNCNNQLNTVSSQLNNVGSESYAQTQVNNYYAQMKEYQRKWQNGE